jgi:GWxTD domain-containing protein
MRNTLIHTLLIVLFWGCSSSAPVAKRENLSSMYGKGGSGLQVLARVYHTDATSSTVYFKLRTRDLLYKSSGEGGPFRAAVQLRYESFPDWGSKTLLDSASTVIKDSSDDPSLDKELIGTFPMRSNGQNTFILKLTATDLNRDNQGVLYFRVRRSGEDVRQYFLPLDERTALPLFQDQVHPGNPVKVRCEAYAGRTLWVGHLKSDNALPAPVFSSSSGSKSSNTTDSLFSVAVDSSGTFSFEPFTTGVYHFRPDSASISGYTLLAMDQSHPIIGTAADMLRPMRYITSVQEYDRMAKAENVRLAVERFWIDAAGERERARDAIRIYFERVETANRHFTSDVEGWRTDRGMVHIIFGQPTSIQKSDLSETWIYGEENNLMSLVFTFVKRQSPYTDNQLVLERDPALKGAWYRNVESWRNGRIYQN